MGGTQSKQSKKIENPATSITDSERANKSSPHIATDFKIQRAHEVRDHKQHKTTNHMSVGTINHGQMEKDEQGCSTYISGNPRAQQAFTREETTDVPTNAIGVQNQGTYNATYHNSTILIGSNQEQRHDSDQTRKQKILSRSILSQLNITKDDKYWKARMELYTAIYDTNDDDLMKNLSVIDVSETKLTSEEAHIIGSLIANSGGLKYLGLWSCNVDCDNVAIITKCLKRQIRVDDIDLRQNNLSSEALGSFLGLRQSETKCLHWKVVQSTRVIPSATNSTRPVQSIDIKLKNEVDVIKISSDEKDLKGQYHVKECKLILDTVYWLDDLIYCSELFVPEFIEIPDELIYVTLDDLREISETNIIKSQLNKVLLDCTEEENIDWRLILDFVKKYQVILLNIVAKGETSMEEDENILINRNGLSISGVQVNIHRMFRVYEADDVWRMLYACQQTKMEFVRCIVGYGLGPAVIHTLVGNLEKLTLIYFDESHTLKGWELEEFHRISYGFGTRLEMLVGEDRYKDAWWSLDFKDFWEDISSSSDESSSDESSRDESSSNGFPGAASCLAPRWP